MWVLYCPASIHARAIIESGRCESYQATADGNCARVAFVLISQSMLWLAEPFSDTTLAGIEPFGMYLLTMIFVYISISYREQNCCKFFPNRIAQIFTKIFSRARGRVLASWWATGRLLTFCWLPSSFDDSRAVLLTPEQFCWFCSKTGGLDDRYLLSSKSVQYSRVLAHQMRARAKIIFPATSGNFA